MANFYCLVSISAWLWNLEFGLPKLESKSFWAFSHVPRHNLGRYVILVKHLAFLDHIWRILSPGQGSSLVMKSWALYKNRNPKIAMSFFAILTSQKTFRSHFDEVFRTFWSFLALLTRVLSILWPGWNPLSFLPSDKKSLFWRLFFGR